MENLLTSNDGFNWAVQKRKLDELSNVHDLRRSVASKMAQLGTAPHIIERILNHITGSGSALQHVYQRYQYEKEMREALEHYHSHLHTVLQLPAS